MGDPMTCEPGHTTAYMCCDEEFSRTLWCYVIIAIVVILIGVILLSPCNTVSNILITLAWVVATCSLLIASLYTLTGSTGSWYYFTLVVTVLLVIFSLIWCGEYHNRGSNVKGSHYHSHGHGTSEIWYTSITVIIIIGMMIMLGCALHSIKNKSYSIPTAAVALLVWLIIAFC